MHEDNKAKGFSVLAFPCNQFGAQEPCSDEEILEFATSTYDVTFPMFSKIEVNGAGEAPLYTFLKADHPDEEGASDIAWNFTKFLVGGDGAVLARYAPTVTPEEIAENLPVFL